MTELHELLSTTRPAIVTITETWLDSSFDSNLLTDGSNYSIYRKDRADGYGGVCVLVNNNCFHSVAVSLPDKFNSLDVVSVDLIDAYFKCRIIAVYRPPTSNTDPIGLQYCSKLADCIDHLLSVNSTVLLCGDFNIPDLNKCNFDVFSSTSMLSNLFSKHALTQYVSDPTRYNSYSDTATLLDLVLCNDPNFVFNIQVCTSFSTSDHCVVHFDILNCKTEQNSLSSGSFDFKRADWAGILTYLQRIDFTSDFTFYITAEEKFKYFYDVLYDCISLNVPYVDTNRATSRFKYPLYIRRQLRRKKSAWALYKRWRNESTLSRYKVAASKYRGLIYKFIKNREASLIDSGNLSKFYRYCNRKFNNRSIIGPLKSDGGSLVVNPRDKVELFRKSFASFYNVYNNIRLCHLLIVLLTLLLIASFLLLLWSENL